MVQSMANSKHNVSLRQVGRDEPQLRRIKTLTNMTQTLLSKLQDTTHLHQPFHNNLYLSNLPTNLWTFLLGTSGHPATRSHHHHTNNNPQDQTNILYKA